MTEHEIFAVFCVLMSIVVYCGAVRSFRRTEARRRRGTTIALARAQRLEQAQPVGSQYSRVIEVDGHKVRIEGFAGGRLRLAAKQPRRS